MKNKTKDLIKISLGMNAFEWYDYTIFSFSAYYFGKNFFNASNAYMSILTGFFVLSAGYLIRPLGAILSGYIAARWSSTHSLNINIFLMAIPAVFIGFLPTYMMLGITAPILLIILRTVQGIGSGGETSAAFSYMYDQENGRFFVTMTAVGAIIAILLASLVFLILRYSLSPTEMLKWGFRIPFLLSIPIAVFVITIRKRIFCYRIINKSSFTLKHTFFNRSFIKSFYVGILLSLMYPTIFFTLFFWLPIYLDFVHHISFAKNLSFIGLLALVLTMTIVGFAIKTWNLKKTFLLFTLLVAGILLITFPVVIQTTSMVVMAGIFILYGIIIGLELPVTYNLLASMFGTQERTMGISLSKDLCDVIAGIAPILFTYLSYHYSIYMIPYFVSFLGLLSLFGLIFIIRTNNHR